jgi:hypothetical protein
MTGDRWEYRLVQVDYRGSKRELIGGVDVGLYPKVEAVLEALSGEGWEAVALSGENMVRVLLRRPRPR